MSSPTPQVAPFDAPGEHLTAELAWLELVLRQRAFAVAVSRGPDEKLDELAGLCVTAKEIARYADEADGTAQPLPDQRAAALDARIRRTRAEIDARVSATVAAGVELPLQRLLRRFRLSPAELRALVACLAPDWELRFQRYFAYLQNDVGRRRPTVQLLGELCVDTDTGVAAGAFGARALFSPDATLLRERLLAIPAASDVPFPAREPVVAEAIADYLAGTVRPDPVLIGVVTIRQPRADWPAGSWYARHREIVEALLTPLGRDGHLPTSYVWGASGCGKGLVTRSVAAVAGVRLLRADCRTWLASGTCSREAVRALRRDALVHGCLIELARCEALVQPEAIAARTAIEEFLGENAGAGIVLTGTLSIEALSAAIATPLRAFEIGRPDISERADLWTRELDARGWRVDPQLVDLVSYGFRFTPREIVRALDGCGAPASAEGAQSPDHQALVRSCREASRRSIQRFARKIVPRRGWDDLVLPLDCRTQLEEICASARNRRRVHGEWGFERKLALGTGLIVLFAGPSGVGKTMSAEIVAAELGLDLFAVDLSGVVSKYIGETEKNLSVVFDEAEATSAVLFFDECDALFGKRTEIKDAHDRYANIEVNYLLQRVDRFEGIVILATNLRSNVDAAFTRRIRHAVEFPFPDGEQREQIWRMVFPPQAPVDPDIDVGFLARQFKLTGGNIKNIAVNAAFLGAASGGSVGMKHVIHATRRELQKMGRACTKAEFGRYFSWVHEGVGASP